MFNSLMNEYFAFYFTNKLDWFLKIVDFITIKQVFLALIQKK